MKEENMIRCLKIAFAFLVIIFNLFFIDLIFHDLKYYGNDVLFTNLFLMIFVNIIIWIFYISMFDEDEKDKLDFEG